MDARRIARTRSRLHRDEGAVALVVALVIVGLLTVAAVAVDSGVMYTERRQLQTAADAAALAGVVALPGNPNTARTVAAQYADLNTENEVEIAVEIKKTFVANDTIKVTVTNPNRQLFFARVFGKNSQRIAARAAAVAGSPTAYGSGVMPFGIIASGTPDPPYGYASGVELTLVCSIGDQSQGNWHYLDLFGYSDSNTLAQIISSGGTTKTLSIGDIINTQTGSQMNPAFGALTNWVKLTCNPHPLTSCYYDAERKVYEGKHLDGTPCNRLLTVPVIVRATGPNPYDWSTATGTEAVKVIGFLNMFIANNPDFKDGVLKATFVQVVPDDALSPGPYNPYAGLVTWLEE